MNASQKVYLAGLKTPTREALEKIKQNLPLGSDVAAVRVMQALTSQDGFADKEEARNGVNQLLSALTGNEYSFLDLRRAVEAARLSADEKRDLSTELRLACTRERVNLGSSAERNCR